MWRRAGAYTTQKENIKSRSACHKEPGIVEIAYNALEFFLFLFSGGDERDGEHQFSQYPKLWNMYLTFLQTDPFNRSILTADMLIPHTELKAKIEAFLYSHRQ